MTPPAIENRQSKIKNPITLPRNRTSSAGFEDRYASVTLARHRVLNRSQRRKRRAKTIARSSCRSSFPSFPSVRSDGLVVPANPQSRRQDSHPHVLVYETSASLLRPHRQTNTSHTNHSTGVRNRTRTSGFGGRLLSQEHAGVDGGIPKPKSRRIGRRQSTTRNTNFEIAQCPDQDLNPELLFRREA